METPGKSKGTILLKREMHCYPRPDYLGNNPTNLKQTKTKENES